MLHTLILWKLIFQFAPALVGMNLSPSLLGEDNGEPVGVRPCRLWVSFCKANRLSVWVYLFMNSRKLGHVFDQVIYMQLDNNTSSVLYIYIIEGHRNTTNIGEEKSKTRLTTGLKLAFWMLICRRRRCSYSGSILRWNPDPTASGWEVGDLTNTQKTQTNNQNRSTEMLTLLACLFLCLYSGGCPITQG